MIEILLATYNGEAYLRQQLDSLFAQSFQDFRILARDDGSADGTVSILSEYEKQHPEQMKIIRDDRKGGSPARNFFILLEHASADYVMFCDQDDVWLKNKIGTTYDAMRQTEQVRGKDTPCLVYADYRAVGADLEEILFNEKHSQVYRHKLDVHHLLVQNYVTGCLMICNRALYVRCGAFEDGILMHDWWLALLASGCGVIRHIPETVMLYRQHGNNQAGAVDVKSFRYRLGKIRDKETRSMQYRYLKQAQVFYDRYRQILDPPVRKSVCEFIGIWETPGKARRILLLIKGRYLKSDLVRILGQLWYL